MHFTKEVSWTAFDFLAAAILFASTILAIEIVLRNITGKLSRLILCTIIVVALGLIWIELAVGIFWSPFAGS